MKVDFYKSVKDDLFEYAVIVSKYKGAWVFCKHKERNTYECPGGHREENEDIIDTAKRELWEETGAVKYNLKQVSAYSVISGDKKTFGMLYFADILEFEKLPDLEIENLEFFNTLPTNWTYPLIQPLLLKKVNDEIFKTT